VPSPLPFAVDEVQVIRTMAIAQSNNILQFCCLSLTKRIQGFTYRVKDAMRNVTRKTIKRARIAEIEQVIMCFLRAALDLDLSTAFDVL
jgi:hypothetical protein